jgi:hypothetical protein
MKESEHEFLGVVFVNSKKNLALSLLLAALGITSSLNCSASDDDMSSENYRDIALEIFMDSFGKTLIMGYIPPENLNALTFLEDDNYFYENDTSLLYVTTGSLAEIHGNNRSLTLNLKGHFDEYQVLFYIPKDIKLVNVTKSENIEYFVSDIDDTIVIESLGSALENPSFSIHCETLT